jgi:outer membrane protein assembly factor BamB
MIFGSRVTSTAGLVPVAALTAANNWPGVNGGPQREGWARPEAMMSRATVGAVKLLYTRTLDEKPHGGRVLTPPLVLGNLISYRGFKEMLFLAGTSDTVYSIDAVLNRVLWSTRLPVKDVPPSSEECAGGSAAIVMTGTSATAMGGVAAIRRPGSLPPGVLPAAATSKNPLVVGLASGFGRNGLVLAMGRDGQIYPLYQSNGAPFVTPIPFLPPNSRIQSLNLFDNTLHAATIGGCGGRNAVYAVDLAANVPTGAKFETGEAARGSAGTAIGNDGVVYAHAGNRLVALTPKDLREKDHFVLPGAAQGITPSVFGRGRGDVIVAGGVNRLVLLDSASLGGADHQVPLAAIDTAGTPRGAFATWADPDTGVRWIYAPLQKSPSAAAGSIAAFKVEERSGRPVLTLAWTAPEMVAPAAPVVGNGLLFVLSTGDSTKAATLSILDATTGKQLFSSGDAVRGPADASTGLAVANGRVYFSTLAGIVYSFGIPTEQ